jgi:T3SS negative regulator,GrlR
MGDLDMANRLNGFYVAEYDGMTENGTVGRGVAVVRDGKIHGGDSHTCFVGTLQEVHDVIVANLSLYPLSPAGYQSISGYESDPWIYRTYAGK